MNESVLNSASSRKFNLSYIKDISKVLLGNVSSQLVVFLGLPLLSRVYTPSDFAVQNLFIQLLGFASLLISWRYEYLVVLPENREKAQALKHLVLFLSTVGLIIGFPLIWIWRTTICQFLGASDLISYLPLLVPFGALSSLSILYQNSAQREEQFELSSIADVLSKIVYIITASLGAWIVWGAWGLILAQFISIFSKSIWIMAFLKERQFKKNAISLLSKDMFSVCYEYRKLAVSISTSHFLMALYAGLPSFFIVSNYGNEVFGQYAMVLSTLFIPTYLIGSSLGQVFYQRAAANRAAKKNFLSLWNKTISFLLIIGIPTYILIWLLAETLYPVILGPNWVSTGVFAKILVPAALMSFLSLPFERGCLVVGAWKYPLVWHLFRTLSVGVLILLAYYYSWPIKKFIMGLNFQMLLCYLIDFVFERFYAKLERF